MGVFLIIHDTGNSSTDKELKLYFMVWISKSFEVHWLKLGTKLFLDGSSDLSLTLQREFRETQGCCVCHSSWAGTERQRRRTLGDSLWSPDWCGSVFPAGTGSQHPSEGGRAAGSSLGKTLWFNEWGSVRLPGQWACCAKRGIAELLEKGRIPLKSAGVRAARKVLDALY